MQRQKEYGDDHSGGDERPLYGMISDIANSGTFEFELLVENSAGRTENDTGCNDDCICNAPDAGNNDNANPDRTVKVTDITIMEPPPERHARTRLKPDHNTKRANRMYFTKRPLCRMICTVSDVSVLDAMTSKMLGPRADFAAIRIDAESGRLERSISLLANITNSVQMPGDNSTVRLGMAVVDVLDTATGRSLERNEIADIAAAATTRKTA